MRKKTKGFTILELIIALSLTVVVLGVVYIFFFSSSKTITTTEINSHLQSESESIQKELLFYGTQAEELVKIIDNNNISFIDKVYGSLSDTNGKLDVAEIKFKVGVEYFTFLYDKNTLTLKNVDESDREVTDTSSKLLSANVTEFKIRPLDYRMNPSGKFKNTTGLEISLVLNKKKGYSDVTIPLSIIVKFRNK